MFELICYERIRSLKYQCNSTCVVLLTLSCNCRALTLQNYSSIPLKCIRLDYIRKIHYYILSANNCASLQPIRTKFTL